MEDRIHSDEMEEGMAASPSHDAQWGESLVIAPSGIKGRLELPAEASGIVVFAHGSGSGRHSPRNRYVAEVLRQAGLGTLLCDLLTEDEATDRQAVFSIGLLAHRLETVLHHVTGHAATEGLPVGLFGASTGAAAALVAAAERPATVGAVVSRGGRPDLAGELHLKNVTAPTLLIVGGDDTQVLALNESARACMTCPTELSIVSGATHLFEEPGTLEEVARLAAAWFRRWLPREAQDARH
jgi:putative phosphoribosyl transferase